MADLKTLGVILRNALWGGNLASLKLWRHPQQMADYMRHTLVLFQAYTSTRGLPQKNVFEVLPTRDVEAIRLGSLKRETTLYGEPWFHSLTSYSVDIINLCLICQILRPNIVFEIGTFHGYTALHLALNTPPESRVYTLDLPAGQSPMLGTTWVDNAQVKGHESTIRPTDRPTYCFAGVPEAQKISCLCGDSATFDYSPYIGIVDLFFIDGAHSYDYVRSDTLNALNCCHAGSVIAWHDFGRLGVNGVSQWLIELSRTRKIYCVPGGSLAFMVVE